jgi:hypothetical protein
MWTVLFRGTRTVAERKLTYVFRLPYSAAKHWRGEEYGWEFVLSSVNLNGQLSWSTDFNLSTYKNKVVRLGPTGDPIIVGNASDGYNITRIGQPIGMFYGFIVDGIFKNAAELAAGPIYNKGLADATRVGDIGSKTLAVLAESLME